MTVQLQTYPKGRSYQERIEHSWKKFPKCTGEMGRIHDFFQQTFFFKLWALPKEERENNRSAQLYREFWKNESFYDVRLPSSERIKECFTVQDIKIVIDETQTINAKVYRVEGKTMRREVYLGGNLATLENNLFGIYPELEFATKNLQPIEQGLELIVFSHYDNQQGDDVPYKYPNFSEMGIFFLKFLKAIQKNRGEVDFLRGHSIGCMTICAALKQLTLLKTSDLEKALSIIPKKIMLDRGGSSIKELSKSQFSGLGISLLPFASYFGWNEDFQQDLIDFFTTVSDSCSTSVEKFTICFLTAEEDPYFAHACLADDRIDILSDLGVEILKLSFHSPEAYIHPVGQHNLSLDRIMGRDLSCNDIKILREQTVAEGLFSRIFDVRTMQRG